MKLLEFVFANLALQHTIFHMKVTQGHVLKKIYEQFRVSYVDATFKDFSRYVDIPTSRMSEYVNNKRKITPVAIDKIATKLSLAEPLKADLERTAMEYGNRKQKHLNRRLLSSSEFSMISDPIYYDFLALVDTVDFSNDPQWIASRLNVSVEKVNHVIDTLRILNLLSYEDGALRLKYFELETSNELASEHICDAHRAYLARASAMLDSAPLALREYQSTVMAVDPRHIPKVKKLIRDFSDKIMRLMETGERSEVFQIGIQLCPVTENRTISKSK